MPLLSLGIDELKNWEQVKFLSVAVDRLETWYKEGLLCIGDSAHAMSPIGGVGINLAIQDAVATANILIPVFAKRVPTIVDFKRIQKRREYPTKRTQGLQVFLHTHAIEPILKSTNKLKLPFVFQLLNIFPFLRGIPARIIGIGFRPEHVRTVENHAN